MKKYYVFIFQLFTIFSCTINDTGGITKDEKSVISCIMKETFGHLTSEHVCYLHPILMPASFYRGDFNLQIPNNLIVQSELLKSMNQKDSVFIKNLNGIYSPTFLKLELEKFPDRLPRVGSMHKSFVHFSVIGFSDDGNVALVIANKSTSSMNGASFLYQLKRNNSNNFEIIKKDMLSHS